jgi:hypothetical protein
MCHSLSKVVSGEVKRQIITIPPRHLKSICTSVALPAFNLRTAAAQCGPTGPRAYQA